MSLIVDPEAMSLMLAWSYAFIEFDHEILSTVIFLLLLIQEGLVSVTNKGYVHEVLGNVSVKLDQKRCD